jgi:aspartyl/asparaginyl beta-hydroxylase (cupin superfamily)
MSASSPPSSPSSPSAPNKSNSSRRRAFYDPAIYPQLARVEEKWPAIRDEARIVLDTLGHLLSSDSSYILPLVPEVEDRSLFPDEIYARARQLAPLTTEIVGNLPGVIAFAFSRLARGKHIPEHEHWNPYLVAILCLQGGGQSHIIVGGQRRDFEDGKTILFDYTVPHQSKNEGEQDRIVLLMMIDPRRTQAVSG